jgi:hypothetical protein
VPYDFLVERPALRTASVTRLTKLQTGDTAKGTSHVSLYCCPAAPFGPSPTYTGAPMNEDGAEHLYSYDINEPVVNFGVSVISATPGSLVDPFVLGSKDENDVQGYAGTPTDVNALTYDYNVDIGAAGVQFPRLQRFYVSVDSRADSFTNRPQPGQYLLNSWVNDVTPPTIRVLTTRITAGRPTIVAQAIDLGAGVDPASLVLSYDKALIGASAYDPVSGLVVFGLPPAAPALKPGKTAATVEASDYQEAKNINTIGNALMPNTEIRKAKLTVVAGPTLTWLTPPATGCTTKTADLAVVAGSAKQVKKVTFADDGKTIGVDRSGPAGIFNHNWNTAKLRKGVHHLTATLVDAAGHTASAGRQVKICK